MQNVFGPLCVISAVAVAGYLIGRLQAYLMIWLFFVPARRKLPIYFNAIFSALPWCVVAMIPFYWIEGGTPYQLITFQGLLVALGLAMIFWGSYVFANRFAELMQKEGWMSAGRARNAKIWAGCVALLGTAFVAYQAISAQI